MGPARDLPARNDRNTEVLTPAKRLLCRRQATTRDARVVCGSRRNWTALAIRRAVHSRLVNRETPDVPIRSIELTERRLGIPVVRGALRPAFTAFRLGLRDDRGAIPL